MKRLSKYAKVTMIEVPAEKPPKHLNAAEIKSVTQKEGARILAKIRPHTHVIMLMIEGHMFTSEQFATKIEKLNIYGKSKLCFVIGGSFGLCKTLLTHADETVSFSKMTFPHQLMRLILLEQIYRSFRIIRGEPYHK